ncbi:hypothetical protein [Pseudomonas leptonychotis]|uniref:hypothetical protein n=1 Tax=Pseudomonas leptonychotis TaxID=2448482 RepID=UPI003869FF61
MTKPVVAHTMTSAMQAVIWQPFIEDAGGPEPALLVQRDAGGLLVITQEGREILIQHETLPALFQQLKRLAAEDGDQ